MAERRTPARQSDDTPLVCRARQLRPRPMEVGVRVGGSEDSRVWVRGQTRTRQRVVHRWCTGAIVVRHFVWVLGDGNPTHETGNMQHATFLTTILQNNVSGGQHIGGSCLAAARVGSIFVVG